MIALPPRFTADAKFEATGEHLEKLRVIREELQRERLSTADRWKLYNELDAVIDSISVTNTDAWIKTAKKGPR